MSLSIWSISTPLSFMSCHRLAEKNWLSFPVLAGFQALPLPRGGGNSLCLVSAATRMLPQWCCVCPVLCMALGARWEAALWQPDPLGRVPVSLHWLALSLLSAYVKHGILNGYLWILSFFTFIGWNSLKTRIKFFLSYRKAEWILNYFTSVAYFQTKELVPYLPAVETVILILAFSFFFLMVNVRSSWCSVFQAVAGIVQLVFRLSPLWPRALLGQLEGPFQRASSSWELPCFLAWQDVPNSRCPCFDLYLNEAISPRSPGSF